MHFYCMTTHSPSVVDAGSKQYPSQDGLKYAAVPYRDPAAWTLKVVSEWTSDDVRNWLDHIGVNYQWGTLRDCDGRQLKTRWKVIRNQLPQDVRTTMDKALEAVLAL